MSNKNLFKSLWLLMLFLVVGTVSAQQNVAKIGSAEYATLEAAFTAAQSGQTVELLAASYTGNDLAAIGKLNNKNVTVVGQGMDATVLKVVYGQNGSDVNGLKFKNLTLNIDHSGYSMPYTQTLCGDYENVKFIGCIATDHGKSTFTNCTFAGSTTGDEYLLWQYAGQMEVTGCTFTASGSKAPAKIYCEAGYDASMTITNCKFTGGVGSKGCALYTSNSNNTDKPIYEIYITETTLSGTNVTATTPLCKPSGNGISVINPTKDSEGKFTAGLFMTANTNETTVTNVISNACASSYQPQKNTDGTYGEEAVSTPAGPAGYNGATLPAAPVVEGDVINVTAANAQYVLDGAYGTIDGKTINFTENITEKLVLGRPTKYEGSNTEYRHGGFAKDAMSYEDFIAYKTQAGWTEYCYYNRAISNVTFTANEGVEVAGFTACGGDHVYGTTAAPIYDYVRDNGTWCSDTNNGYYVYTELKNIKFDGLTFTGNVDFSTSSDNTVFDNFEFNGCTFNINNTTKVQSNQAIRYYSEGVKGNVKNLLVENCTFNKVYQAVYTMKAVGIHIESNTVAKTSHNVFCIMTGGKVFNSGEVVINNNTVTEAGHPMVRLENVASGTTITIKDNDASFGNGTEVTDEKFIEAGSVAEGVTVVCSGNKMHNFAAPSHEVFNDKAPTVSIDVHEEVVISGTESATTEEQAAANTAVEALESNTAITTEEATNVAEVEEVTTLAITVKEVAVETTPAVNDTPATATVTKVTYDVQPMKDEEKVTETTEVITFRLPVPQSFTNDIVKVSHKHNGNVETFSAFVQGTGAAKYVELASTKFSDWTIEDIATLESLEITTANDLVKLSTYVNAGNSLSGKTVKLANDIDMTGVAFSPIGTDSHKFMGTFDGQNHIISNLTITASSNDAGLFGKVFGATIKDVKLSNANVTNTAENYTGLLVGAGYANIDNCEITGGSVIGVDQVGAVIGYLSCGYVKNCTVDGVAVTANGDRAGGITGKANIDSNYDIIGNTVKNSTIIAAKKVGEMRSAAALVGQVMASASNHWVISDNDIISVTTKTADDETFVPVSEFRPDQFQADALTGGHIVRNHWEPATDPDTYVMYDPSNSSQFVTIENFYPVAKIETTKYASLADAFAAVPTNGTATEIKVLKNCEGNGIIVNAGQSVSVDFGGHTYTVNTDVLAGSNGTKNQAFQLLKNATVEFKNGAIVGDNANIKMLIQNYSNLTLDNMTLDATQGTNSVTYVLSTNNGSTTINNTVITAKEDGIAFDVCAGWGGYTSNAVEVKGESVINGKIEVSKDSKNEATENLTLTAGDFTAATIVVAAGGDQVEVTKGTDAVVTAPTGYYWDNNVLTMYAVKVGESYYATLAEAFAAVQDGQTITVLKDCAGDGIKVAEGRNFTVDFNGKTYTIDGETVGSSGTQTNGFQLLKNSTLTFKNGTITSTKAKILIQNYSDLTLDKMILDGASLQGAHPYTLSTNNGASTIKDTKIIAHEDGVAFDVCSFGSYTSNTVSVEGSSEIVGPVELSRTNAAPLALNLNGGDFSAASIIVAAGGEDAVVKKDAAVEITAPAGYMWNNNQLIAAVAKIGDNSYATLSEAFAAVQNGETITVLKDCAGDGIKVAEGRNFTVDFNGKTYTIDGETVGSAGTQTNGFQLLKNSTLTFKNGTITSTKAKILIQNYSNLTLDKMILDGASLQGDRPYTLSTNNGASTIKDTKIIAHENGVAFDVCSFGSYTSNTVSVEGDSKIVGPVELSRTNEAPLALNLNGGDFSEASIIVTDGGEDAVVKKDAAVTLSAPEDYEWNSENILVPTACEMTVYVGNATGHTVSTLVEWKNIQKEHPNAMALVSDNLAVKVAGLTNVIVDYTVGHNNHYYECENFELTDGYGWYSPVKEFTAVKGSYSRTIYDGLNAICVPFEIGEGVPFTKHVFHSSNEAGTTAYFNSITNVNAGKAFIAQVSGTSSWIFNFDNTPIFDNPMEGGAFRGTYRDSNVSNCYKINDAGTGLQYHSTAMNYAFRGYFVLENENLFGGQPNNLRIAFDEIEDDTTGISAIGNGTNVDVIYNVQGLRLSKQQKGINILNGKKVLK